MKIMIALLLFTQYHSLMDVVFEVGPNEYGSLDMGAKMPAYL